jgi:hypothetical protein
MSILTQTQVHELEAEIINLAVKLGSARHFSEGEPGGCTRDDLGTLHVNLCGLMRRAEALAKRLETSHGFIRGK